MDEKVWVREELWEGVLLLIIWPGKVSLLNNSLSKDMNSVSEGEPCRCKMWVRQYIPARDKSGLGIFEELLRRPANVAGAELSRDRDVGIKSEK